MLNMNRNKALSAVPPMALTIAGSDSGGCAGIQADLKTFAALEVHGVSVITAVTAQSTLGVRSWEAVSHRLIREQIETVCDDISVRATKTGMLPTSEVIRLVAQLVQERRLHPLIVDPVMVASSGDSLMNEGAVSDLKRTLLPLADLITPNRREAEVLASTAIRDLASARAAANQIRDLGAKAVLLKGGHLDDNPNVSVDILVDGDGILELRAERIVTKNTHGSGCTLSAAVAANLALGHPLREACRRAKLYVTEAIRHSFSIGGGPGPLGHFWRWWSPFE
jgi:hydroxymethylpyrimidine/phosphomethylpyrimidine kinase